MKSEVGNDISKERYTLTLTGEQAFILQQACELLARMGMHQYGHIGYLPGILMEHPFLVEKLRGLESALARDDKPPRNRSPWYDIAWDMYQVVRYRLSWDKFPEGGMGVCFDEPLKSGKEVLAKIERKK